VEANIERIKNDIDIVTSFNRTPGNGCTRFSYSEEDRKAREYLINEMKKLGLEVKIDGVGNIRGKYNPMNSNYPSVMMGSHIDTVLNGGKFDGLVGVVSALEVIRQVKDNQISIQKPLEIIIWAEEEGSNSGITMLGSKAMTGKVKAEDLKEIKSFTGESMYDLMKEFGLDVDAIDSQVFRKDEVEYLIELHVEQGGILDSEGLSVGIVKAIAGMKTYKVTLEGVANHAGSTPMYLRNDALVGASHIITYMEDAAKNKGLGTTVATVGKIICEPNVPNIIPGKVVFYVDIRDVEEEGKDIISKELIEKVKENANLYNLKYDIELIGESPVVKLSEKVIDTIEKIAIERSYPYKVMNSGAVHDSGMFADLTNVGMIFVPSIGGRSHCPEELTRFEDIKLGCDLLLETVIRLAQ